MLYRDAANPGARLVSTSGTPVSPNFKMTFARYEPGTFTLGTEHFTNHKSGRRIPPMKICEALRTGYEFF